MLCGFVGNSIIVLGAKFLNISFVNAYMLFHLPEGIWVDWHVKNVVKNLIVLKWLNGISLPNHTKLLVNNQ